MPSVKRHQFVFCRAGIGCPCPSSLAQPMGATGNASRLAGHSKPCPEAFLCHRLAALACDECQTPSWPGCDARHNRRKQWDADNLSGLLRPDLGNAVLDVLASNPDDIAAP
jgi:hypothetical protein